MTSASAPNASLEPDWDKCGGLLPVVVQDADTGHVLMMAYMNDAALRTTQSTGRVTFYSRSKQRLWTKGETSGHYLKFVGVSLDCDQDALLVLAEPHGPTCHLGTSSCFGESVRAGSDSYAFLAKLDAVIAQRIREQPEGSYAARLWSQGPARMAQKVGEEGVEVALAAVTQGDEALLGEAADLIFHLTLLLKSRDLSLSRVVAELEQRHASKVRPDQLAG